MKSIWSGIVGLGILALLTGSVVQSVYHNEQRMNAFIDNDHMHSNRNGHEDNSNEESKGNQENVIEKEREKKDSTSLREKRNATQTDSKVPVAESDLFVDVGDQPVHLRRERDTSHSLPFNKYSQPTLYRERHKRSLDDYTYIIHPEVEFDEFMDPSRMARSIDMEGMEFDDVWLYDDDQDEGLSEEEALMRDRRSNEGSDILIVYDDENGEAYSVREKRSPLRDDILSREQYQSMIDSLTGKSNLDPSLRKRRNEAENVDQLKVEKVDAGESTNVKNSADTPGNNPDNGKRGQRIIDLDEEDYDYHHEDEAEYHEEMEHGRLDADEKMKQQKKAKVRRGFDDDDIDSIFWGEDDDRHDHDDERDYDTRARRQGEGEEPEDDEEDEDNGEDEDTDYSSGQLPEDEILSPTINEDNEGDDQETDDEDEQEDIMRRNVFFGGDPSQQVMDVEDFQAGGKISNILGRQVRTVNDQPVAANSFKQKYKSEENIVGVLDALENRQNMEESGKRGKGKRNVQNQGVVEFNSKENNAQYIEGNGVIRRKGRTLNSDNANRLVNDVKLHGRNTESEEDDLDKHEYLDTEDDRLESDAGASVFEVSGDGMKMEEARENVGSFVIDDAAVAKVDAVDRIIRDGSGMQGLPDISSMEMRENSPLDRYEENIESKRESSYLDTQPASIRKNRYAFGVDLRDGLKDNPLARGIEMIDSGVDNSAERTANSERYDRNIDNYHEMGDNQYVNRRGRLARNIKETRNDGSQGAYMNSRVKRLGDRSRQRNMELLNEDLELDAGLEDLEDAEFDDDATSLYQRNVGSNIGDRNAGFLNQRRLRDSEDRDMEEEGSQAYHPYDRSIRNADSGEDFQEPYGRNMRDIHDDRDGEYEDMNQRHLREIDDEDFDIDHYQEPYGRNVRESDVEGLGEDGYEEPYNRRMRDSENGENDHLDLYGRNLRELDSLDLDQENYQEPYQRFIRNSNGEELWEAEEHDGRNLRDVKGIDEDSYETNERYTRNNKGGLSDEDYYNQRRMRDVLDEDNIEDYSGRYFRDTDEDKHAKDIDYGEERKLRDVDNSYEDFEGRGRLGRSGLKNYYDLDDETEDLNDADMKDLNYEYNYMDDTDTEDGMGESMRKARNYDSSENVEDIEDGGNAMGPDRNVRMSDGVNFYKLKQGRFERDDKKSKQEGKKKFVYEDEYGKRYERNTGDAGDFDETYGQRFQRNLEDSLDKNLDENFGERYERNIDSLDPEEEERLYGRQGRGTDNKLQGLREDVVDERIDRYNGEESLRDRRDGVDRYERNSGDAGNNFDESYRQRFERNLADNSNENLDENYSERYDSYGSNDKRLQGLREDIDEQIDGYNGQKQGLRDRRSGYDNTANREARAPAFLNNEVDYIDEQMGLKSIQGLVNRERLGHDPVRQSRGTNQNEPYRRSRGIEGFQSNNAIGKKMKNIEDPSSEYIVASEPFVNTMINGKETIRQERHSEGGVRNSYANEGTNQDEPIRTARNSIQNMQSIRGTQRGDYNVRILRNSINRQFSSNEEPGDLVRNARNLMGENYYGDSQGVRLERNSGQDSGAENSEYEGNMRQVRNSKDSYYSNSLSSGDGIRYQRTAGRSHNEPMELNRRSDDIQNVEDMSNNNNDAERERFQGKELVKRHKEVPISRDYIENTEELSDERVGDGVDVNYEAEKDRILLKKREQDPGMIDLPGADLEEGNIADVNKEGREFVAMENVGSNKGGSLVSDDSDYNIAMDLDRNIKAQALEQKGFDYWIEKQPEPGIGQGINTLHKRESSVSGDSRWESAETPVDKISDNGMDNVDTEQKDSRVSDRDTNGLESEGLGENDVPSQQVDSTDMEQKDTSHLNDRDEIRYGADNAGMEVSDKDGVSGGLDSNGIEQKGLGDRDTAQSGLDSGDVSLRDSSLSEEGKHSGDLSGSSGAEDGMENVDKQNDEISSSDASVDEADSRDAEMRKSRGLSDDDIESLIHKAVSDMKEIKDPEVTGRSQELEEGEHIFLEDPERNLRDIRNEEEALKDEDDINRFVDSVDKYVNEPEIEVDEVPSLKNGYKGFYIVPEREFRDAKDEKVKKKSLVEEEIVEEDSSSTDSSKKGKKKKKVKARDSEESNGKNHEFLNWAGEPIPIDEIELSKKSVNERKKRLNSYRGTDNEPDISETEDDDMADEETLGERSSRNIADKDLLEELEKSDDMDIVESFDKNGNLLGVERSIRNAEDEDGYRLVRDSEKKKKKKKKGAESEENTDKREKSEKRKLRNSEVQDLTDSEDLSGIREERNSEKKKRKKKKISEEEETDKNVNEKRKQRYSDSEIREDLSDIREGRNSEKKKKKKVSEEVETKEKGDKKKRKMRDYEHGIEDLTEGVESDGREERDSEKKKKHKGKKQVSYEEDMMNDEEEGEIRELRDSEKKKKKKEKKAQIYEDSVFEGVGEGAEVREERDSDKNSLLDSSDIQVRETRDGKKKKKKSKGTDDSSEERKVRHSEKLVDIVDMDRREMGEDETLLNRIVDDSAMGDMLEKRDGSDELQSEAENALNEIVSERDVANVNEAEHVEGSDSGNADSESLVSDDESSGSMLGDSSGKEAAVEGMGPANIKKDNSPQGVVYIENLDSGDKKGKNINRNVRDMDFVLQEGTEGAGDMETDYRSVISDDKAVELGNDASEGVQTVLDLGAGDVEKEIDLGTDGKDDVEKELDFGTNDIINGVVMGDHGSSILQELNEGSDSESESDSVNREMRDVKNNRKDKGVSIESLDAILGDEQAVDGTASN